jgi:hypothetical protein
VDPADHVVEFAFPTLPESISHLDLTNLRVGEHTVDLRLRRENGEILVDVIRAEGDVKVRVRK